MARRCRRPSVVTPASAQDRTQVEALAAVQDATGESVGLAWADQGYTGDGSATVAGLHSWPSPACCSTASSPC